MQPYLSRSPASEEGAMSYPYDYDPQKETVQEYVHRHLREAYDEVLDEEINLLLYGQRDRPKVEEDRAPKLKGMSPNATWYDEVSFDGAMEPSPVSIARQAYLYELSLPFRESDYTREHRLRMELKARRTREMRNCLHGRREFPIEWAEGVNPNGQE
jgi:hypothetical protein